MAEAAFTLTKKSGTLIVDWAAGDDGDTGAPIELFYLASLAGAVQVIGGTPGAITLEGSLDGTNWFALSDLSGSAISLGTLADAADFTTAMSYIRPVYGTSASAAVVRAVFKVDR